MFPVEPREVKARMETARVQTLLEMGYPRDLIRQTIEARLAMTGRVKHIPLLKFCKLHNFGRLVIAI